MMTLDRRSQPPVRLAAIGTHAARCLLACVLGWLLVAGAVPAHAQVPPEWSVDPAAYEQSMTVTARVTVDGEPVGEIGDRLAAFVDGEVRGVVGSTAAAGPSGEALFFLTVYGTPDDVAAPVRLRVYDATRQEIVRLSPQQTFRADAAHGTPSAPVTLQAGTQGLPGPADWIVKASDYELSMVVTADVLPGAARTEGSADRVAAFVGGQVRGVSTPIEVSGRWLHFLTIYANPSEAGTPVLFRYHHAESNNVLAPVQTEAFTPDAVRGSPDDPAMLRVEHPAPLLNTISPPQGRAGERVDVTLRGSGYLDGVTEPDVAGEGLAAGAFQVVSDSLARLTIEIDRDAVAGVRTLTLTNTEPGGGRSVPTPFTVVTRDLLVNPLTLQAGPNPVGTVATVRVQSADDTQVSVEVYDVLGRHVTTLYDRLLNRADPVALPFDVSTLSSGTYFVRATSRESTVTTTVSVVR